MANITKATMSTLEEIVEEEELTKRQRIIAARKLQLQRQKRAYGKQPRSLR